MTPLARLLGAITLLSGLTDASPAWIGDHYKSPTEGFSIDSSNILQYQGLSTFWACPASTAEYNIYVHSESTSDQLGCFAITLKANKVGSADSQLTEFFDPATPEDFDKTTVHPYILTSRADRAPRAISPLYTDWETTRDSHNSNSNPRRYGWVKARQLEDFTFTAGQSRWIGTDFFYGCTIFVAVGEEGAIFGHYPQETRTGLVSGLSSVAEFETYYHSGKLNLDNKANDVSYGLSSVKAQRHAFIMSTAAASAPGVAAFKNWLILNDVERSNVKYIPYQGSSGTGEPNPSSASGLGLIKWTSESAAEGAAATLEVFLSSDTAIRTAHYVYRKGKFVLRN